MLQRCNKSRMKVLMLTKIVGNKIKKLRVNYNCKNCEWRMSKKERDRAFAFESCCRQKKARKYLYR